MIKLIDNLYRMLLPLTLRTDAQTAHNRFMRALCVLDKLPGSGSVAGLIGRMQPHQPISVGGVGLPHPLILSAGLVKGLGFRLEGEALLAVKNGDNMIPGWRTIPRLVGPVEFGSYTRYPRPGNPGPVLWRDASTRSTQNRIGLKNPGARAAAMFLSQHQTDLPAVYGVNIAISPGIANPDQEQQEALDALTAFTSAGVRPSWFTLNLSCPNTEDDPSGNQTTDKARRLCRALVGAAGDVPVWVKVGPCLGDDQYAGLMTAFAEAGVRAVIATNTLPAPTPDGAHTAGIGGGRLHDHALHAVRTLSATPQATAVDVIGSGGVLDGASYQAMQQAGAAAVMYYSALIYRSPLAAAIIYQEAQG